MFISASLISFKAIEGIFFIKSGIKSRDDMCEGGHCLMDTQLSYEEDLQGCVPVNDIN